MNKKLVKSFAFVGLMALIVCGNFLSALAVETYTWEEKASMLYPRYRHALVATEDSIFALGGYDAAPTNPANRVEKYNLNTNTWEAKNTDQSSEMTDQQYRLFFYDQIY